MAIERIEWQCPRCRRRYAIPADQPRPALCPRCSSAEQEEEMPPPSSPPPGEAPELSLPLDRPPAGESAAGFDAARYRRKYPLLRTITLVMRCVAGAIVLAMLAGFLFGLVRIFQAEGQDERWLAAAIGVGSLLVGAYWSIVVLAFAELIQVALDIEQNTRQP